MLRRDLDYIVIAAMFLSGLYVATTGLVMDIFGLHRFAFHPFAGYAFAALVGLHLILNWSRVTAFVRRKLRPRLSRERQTRREPAPSLGRRELLFSLLGAMGGFILGGLIRTQRMDQLTDDTDVKDAHTDVGTFYHQWSKPGYLSPLGAILDWGGQPKRYKSYPEAKQIALPDPHGHQGLSLDETIEKRRSFRDYTSEPMQLEELSRLLHAAQGITDQRRGFRAAPSAGALYSGEIYVVAERVKGLAPGLYYYEVRGHNLVKLADGYLAKRVVAEVERPGQIERAAAYVLLTNVFQRYTRRYQNRGYRYALIDSGHIGENLRLAATTFGLAEAYVPRFHDDGLHELLGIDGPGGGCHG